MNIEITNKDTKETVTVCKPLAEIVVNITDDSKRKANARLKLIVTDSAGSRYVDRVISLKNRKGSIAFIAGGKLGEYNISIHESDEVKKIATKNFKLEAVTEIMTDNPIYQLLFNKISESLKKLSVHHLDGKEIKGISWLRDNTHYLKGYKYFEKDTKEMTDYFLRHRMPDGGFYDHYARFKNKIILRRIDCEADLEYLMVEAVHAVWQASGDDEWMSTRLSKLEEGLNYVFTNPTRWSKEHNLAKRPFTIDTWDFEYSEEGVDRAGLGLTYKINEEGYMVRAIDDKTKFCIMHGDNSGLYMACRLLSKMFDYTGNISKKDFWAKKAEEIRTNTNKVCWNDNFYTHQVHIDPVHIPDFDETKQLSLSNSYDLNRGLPTHIQAVKIIKEYQKRRRGNSFAEWFSIDPPFPTGIFSKIWGDENEYINGTVMPLVGGELARAAFEHGFEKYGLDILLRLQKMIERDGRTYFMYDRDGSPWYQNGNPSQGGGPSSWGDAAIFYALIEGLAGIEDISKSYQEVKISPRWAITGEKEVGITAKYGTSDGYFSYRYKFDKDKKIITINFTGSGDKGNFHILLPEGTIAKAVYAGEKIVKWGKTEVENSKYVDFNAPISTNTITIKLDIKNLEDFLLSTQKVISVPDVPTAAFPGDNVTIGTVLKNPFKRNLKTRVTIKSLTQGLNISPAEEEITLKKDKEKQLSFTVNIAQDISYGTLHPLEIQVYDTQKDKILVNEIVYINVRLPLEMEVLPKGTNIQFSENEPLVKVNISAIARNLRDKKTQGSIVLKHPQDWEMLEGEDKIDYNSLLPGEKIETKYTFQKKVKSYQGEKPEISLIATSNSATVIKSRALVIPDKEKIVFCKKAKTTPIIKNGKFNVSNWKDASKLSNFVLNMTGIPVKEQTTAYVTYDDENLFFAIICNDSNISEIVANSKKDTKGRIWEDDGIEIFLDSFYDRSNFCQFVFNSIGAQLEGGFGENKQELDKAVSWEVKTSIEKDCWVSEVTIPFKKLGLTTPKTGDIWGLNITRSYQGEECSQWTCTYGGNARPERFGQMIFIK